MQIQQHTIQLNVTESQKNSAVTISEREVAQVDGQNNNTAELSTKTITSRDESIESHSNSVVKTPENASVTDLDSSKVSKRLVETILEDSITITRATTQPSNANPPAVQLRVATVMTYEQDDSMISQASGEVTTEDGREISFMLELNYQRNTHVETDTEFLGNRDLIDPIVINLNGEAPSFSDSVFEFDINGDGQSNTLYQTNSGTGFLAFDKNGNGQVDDGSELFGPQTGHGFSELAEYDSDGNGWIDSNDDVFTQLGYLDFDANGEEQFRSLADVGFGAIYLQSSQAKFDLYTSEGEFSAQIQRTGVGLMENGAAVAVQEVNFASNELTIERNFAGAQFSAEGGNVINLRNPLAGVQIQNDLVTSRIAETRIQLSRDPAEGSNIALQNSVNTRPADLEIKDPLDINDDPSTVRELIAARMMEATLRTQKEDENLSGNHTARANIIPPVEHYAAPRANEFRFLDNLPNWLSRDLNQDTDQLEDLRATIEALKNMKDQQDKLLEKLGIRSAP